MADLPATCMVPSAVRWMLSEISWVAAPCCSIAADIAVVISEILPMVELIILIEPTASWVRDLQRPDAVDRIRFCRQTIASRRPPSRHREIAGVKGSDRTIWR